MSTSLFTFQHRADEPVGIRISAMLLIILGCFFALYVPFYAALLCIILVRMWHGHRSLAGDPSLLIAGLASIFVCAALWYICFRAAPALREGQRWAAYVAMAFGSIMFSFCGLLLYDLYHPEHSTPDEGFGLLFVPFCLFFGLWWWIYLNLPHVRAHMKFLRKAPPFALEAIHYDLPKQ